QSPFGKDELGIVLRKVQAGEFAPLRLFKPHIPKALEAICLKAMAIHPQDRHPSPQLLAEDVERFLADKPVACYREPLLVRGGRWARMHKASVATAAAVLLTATLGLALGLFFVNAERNRTELARQGEQQQRVEAQKQRALADKQRVEAENQAQLAQ